MRRALLGGCSLGLATGWNISNTGAIAQSLSHRYGVGLATVGLFTTALFVTHLAMQIPGGRTSDRFGARRTGLLGLTIIAVFAAVSMIAPDTGLAIVTRALTGIGTGFGFIAGSAYVRAVGGSPAAQGLYGGVGLAGGGVALAVVPQVESWIGWRAPFATAVAVAPRPVFVLLRHRAGRRAAGPPQTVEEGLCARASSATRASYRLSRGALQGLPGLSVMVGNWVVTLLDRHGGLGKGAAGAIGSLTLALGIVTRPLGGWILREHPGLARRAVGASLAAGAVGTVFAPPSAARRQVAALGAALARPPRGSPFAPAFTGAAVMRPDAPAAAVGLVNGAASAVILARSCLSFSLPGDGRAGFAVVAALWLVSLLVLPSERELGVEPTGATAIAVQDDLGGERCVRRDRRPRRGGG